jgi:hypothetical protein
MIMEMSRILEAGRFMLCRIVELGFGDDVLERFLDDSAIQKESAMRLIEAISRTDDSFIVFAKAVDYRLTPAEMAGVNRHLLKVCDDGALSAMPQISHSLKENVPVVFFKKSDRFDDNDLSHDYFMRCLVPDPYALLAVCREQPEIVSQRECMAHWQNPGKNKWYFAGCSPNRDDNPHPKEGYKISIYCGLDWYENRWCAGVPRSWIRTYCNGSAAL